MLRRDQKCTEISAEEVNERHLWEALNVNEG
jgi:hypothetical protein